MELRNYRDQALGWPSEGRCILAHHDEDHMVVYQAYRPEIGRYAVQHQRFGGEFSFSRMSWIKPNFLWMMYRSGWGVKTGQEVTLAITLSRDFFDEILTTAVPSSFDPSRFGDRDAWKSALADSEVRLQWDPDHAPDGAKLARRAIQLGLRGDMLRRFATEEIVQIEDLSDLVATQREHAHRSLEKLLVPVERVYVPRHEGAASSVGLDMAESSFSRSGANPCI
ncbi:DUF4291 domain-containing protein [Luteolibacter marinus]|uniref:DUF4291 domain-containing protein n=1 Tax=Luteolibacter marinus TaxID=2776705 RepID=UPI001865AAB0|nr:DUF4291 domain-containing protein [Luteolibacter marinus]